MSRRSRDLHFVLPPGIGDTWWVYQKLHPLIGKRVITVEICADPPLRAQPFGDMWQGIRSLGYGIKRYGKILPLLLPRDTDLSTLKRGTHYISCNPALEDGVHLDQIFPKQQTGWHLPINLTPKDSIEAGKVFDSMPTKKRFGFYCSSNLHKPIDSFWSVPEWVSFLKYVREAVPDVSFIGLGTTYDDKTAQVIAELKATKDFPITDGMNKTLGVTLSLIKELTYFFCYPSGLGIMADNFRVPSMLWYWSHCHPNFPGTYTSPESLALDRHIVEKFTDVPSAIQLFEKRGLKWLQ